jgi:uncharacterized protein YgbK (DUF1537 family)
MTIRLAYYADDFTGATDALEQLENAGVRTRLFLRPPSQATLAALSGIEAIGVAGLSRSLPTTEIDAEVRPALRALRGIGAAHIHYKVCSTFDSSPEVGSIGRVIDIAAEEFSASFIPLVVGAPGLGRWCAFGNLFASYGIGADTPAYRLDRHPSMSRHPVTPADEADLRLHLGRQTSKRVHLVDFRALDRGLSKAIAAVELGVKEDEAEVVLFDCLTVEHLRTIGALLEHYAETAQPLFTVGSSAVESALASQWDLPPQTTGIAEAATGPVLVLAGSCSPVTATQIATARQAGLAIVEIDADRIAVGDESLVEEAAGAVTNALSTAPGAIVSISGGGRDRVGSLDARLLGQSLADIYLRVRKQTPIGLTLVAGGDTSSYAARSLRIDALSIHAPLTPGAPVCRALSADALVDRELFVFKGGQVGRPDFLARLVPEVTTHR